MLFQLILDRISKGIHDKVSRGSDLKQALFNFAYKYKRVWTKRGFDTPLMNRCVYILFSHTENISEQLTVQIIKSWQL